MQLCRHETEWGEGGKEWALSILGRGKPFFDYVFLEFFSLHEATLQFYSWLQSSQKKSKITLFCPQKSCNMGLKSRPHTLLFRMEEKRGKIYFPRSIFATGQAAIKETYLSEGNRGMHECISSVFTLRGNNGCVCRHHHPSRVSDSLERS